MVPGKQALTAVSAVWVFVCVSLGAVAKADIGQHANVVPPIAQFGIYGHANGALNSPTGVAVAPDLSMYVSDTYNHRIEVFDKTGKTINSFGKRGDGKGELSFPAGVAIEGDHLFVADSGNRRIVQYTLAGDYVRAYTLPLSVETGSVEWIAVSPQLIAAADTDNFQIVLFDFVTAEWRSIPLPHTLDGVPLGISGIAMNDQYIFAADEMGSRILKISISDKSLVTASNWGSFAGFLANPSGIALAKNRLYFADRINHRIQVFDAGSLQFIGQWARHPQTGHEGSGRLHYPTGIGVDSDAKRIAVCEPVENRCQVFEYQSIAAAHHQTVNDDAWWNKKGRFHYGSRVEAQGDLLVVTEQDTHAALIFDLSEGKPKLIRKIGGFGTEPGKFVMPSGIYIDEAAGTVTISDRGNNRLQEFRVFMSESADGQKAYAVELQKVYKLETVLAETPGLPQDYSLEKVDPGPQLITAAGDHYLFDVSQGIQFRVGDNYQGLEALPSGAALGEKPKSGNVAISPDGKTMYAIDLWHFKVRKLDEAGRVLKEWGEPGPGPAQFLAPFGVAVDNDGNVFVSDSGKHSIKKFDSEGTFIAEYGSYGVGEGQFYKPKGLAFDRKRNVLYVNDFANHRAQVLAPDGKFQFMFGIGEEYVAKASMFNRYQAAFESLTFPQQFTTVVPDGSPAAGQVQNIIDTIDGSMQLKLSTRQPVSRVNNTYEITVELLSGGQPVTESPQLAVSADMPEHQHGLLEQPIIETKDGKFVIHNLQFHMPGHWKVYFDLEREGVVRRAVADVEVQ